jgi:hypothetical protein
LLAQLRKTLNSAPEAAPVIPTPPAEPGRTSEAAARLAQLLREFDAEAVAYIESNHAALRPLFAAEAWAPFAKLVQDYAFAEAQTQLEQALKHCFTHEAAL